MTNRVLDQRYELLERVGGGGMADVYKAQDRLLDRPVAVKILHAQFQSDEEFIEKFHREAQAAARLSHPNIVNIYDVGASGDDHYIVMEYVPGRTLKELIQQRGHLAPEEALTITGEIAEAAAQHSHDEWPDGESGGLWHRACRDGIDDDLQRQRHRLRALLLTRAGEGHDDHAEVRRLFARRRAL